MNVTERAAHEGSPTIRQSYVRAMRRRPIVIAAHTLVLAVLAVAVGGFWHQIDPLEQDLARSLEPPTWSAPLDRANSPQRALLGTDSLGRDLAARLVQAIQLSLAVAAIAVAVATAVGVALGLVAGYVGGVVDATVMRIVDALLSLPFVVLAIAVLAAVGPGLLNVALVLGLTGWVTFAKLVRAQVLSAKADTYVEAARAIGCSHLRILVRHIAPHTIGIVLVNITLSLGQMMLAEAALSFLGLGIPLQTPTLGGILSGAQQTFFAAWWIVVFPGLALMTIVFATNIIGDFLRDYFDPREPS